MIKLEIKLNIFIVNRLTKTKAYLYSSNSNYSKAIEQIVRTESESRFEYKELF
jgi:hypothetical protein